MTLGMIWTIILRFAIQDITVEGSTTFANLLTLSLLILIISAIVHFNSKHSLLGFHCLLVVLS